MKSELHASTTIEVTSDTSLMLTRHFNAPPRQVFRAMTDPEIVPKWYGLAVLSMEVCEIDLRVGGRWRFVLSSPDAGIHGFSGEYREIIPPQRLVFTENYEPLGDGHEILVTSTFEDRSGGTLYTSTLAYESKADRDGHIQSGMEAGARESHDRLAAVLASLEGVEAISRTPSLAT
jgi:uncharacterized protein YndB with AHSA1/START domain